MNEVEKVSEPRQEAVVRVAEPEVLAWACRALKASGMSTVDAETASRVIVDVDLRGIYSHGITRLAIYTERLRSGANDPEGQPRVVRANGAVLTVDGMNAMGQVVGEYAVDAGLKAAREAGLSVVAVRGSNHFGTCAYFVERGAKEGFISYAATLSGGNIMSPWGGAGRHLGNNPFGIGIPTGRHPTFVLDIALSVAARGKVLLAAKEQQPVPEDWGFDINGQPTTDAEKVWEGTVRPVGGHKGYGLALAVALIAGVLPGAAFGDRVTDMYSVFDRPQNVGQFFGFLDVSRVQDVEGFRAQVDAAIDLMHASGESSGNRVYVPGEMEYEATAAQRADGIRYSKEAANEVFRLSEELSIRPPVVRDVDVAAPPVVGGTRQVMKGT